MDPSKPDKQAHKLEESLFYPEQPVQTVADVQVKQLVGHALHAVIVAASATYPSAQAVHAVFDEQYLQLAIEVQPAPVKQPVIVAASGKYPVIHYEQTVAVQVAQVVIVH